MVGVIAPSSRLNSLGSICYCLLALGLHVYSCYAIVERYNEAEARSWKTKGEGGTPVQCTLLLVFMALSSFMMPFFCLACFLKVGNLANDQVQLGFHHALAPAAPPAASSLVAKGSQDTSQLCLDGLKRGWRHFCPISPFLHLVAAFLLVLPQTLLTPVEVKYQYLSTVMCWSSELDFLYPSQRILLSDVKSMVNMTEAYNTSNILLPSSPLYTGGRTDQVTVSVAFVNFSLALAMILVRYASVFWYTNKVLALVFSLQLVAMVVTNIFGYCNFSVLYCVCYNIKVFRNLKVSISCGANIVLFIFGSIILLFSSVLVFEYGANHFHMKFKLVERHHVADAQSNKKKLGRLVSGCQGHVPHSCAMVSLIALAVFKGPLLYDLVSIMRHTGDSLLLSGIVCDVCYMVLWVVLWLCLTIKQEWQFRILDFVPSSQPRYSMPFEENVSEKSSQMCHGDNDLEIDHYLQRRRPVGSRDNVQRYSDPFPIGLRTSGDVYQQSEVGTEGSDIAQATHDMGAMDQEELDPSAQLRQSSRTRRSGGQRVTFDESVRSRGSDKEPRTRSLPRQRVHESKNGDARLDVTADVHPLQAPKDFQDEQTSHQPVSLRQLSPENAVLTREYRNSLRTKCGEYYSSNGHIDQVSSPDDPAIIQTTGEPLPTLMSSFRDKVRESSIAASNFREREKTMLEKYNFLEQSSLSHHQTPNEDGQHCERVLVGDDNICDKGLNDLGSSNHKRFRHGQSTRQQDSEPDLRAQRHNASVSSDEGHQSSFTPSTVDSFDASLAPVHEESTPRGVMTDMASRDYRHMVGIANGNGHLDVGTEKSACPRKPARSNHASARPPLHGPPLPLMLSVKLDGIGRRDSANYSLTSSQDTSSSNESEQGLCSQV